MLHRFIIASFSVLWMAPVSLMAQKWDTLAPIPESFTFPVVAVANGRIHIMGGGGNGGATDHHYAYDPYTNTWETRALVPYRAQQPAGAAANGKIHFFGGGFPNTGTPLDDHFIYDPVTDSWDQGGDLTAPRAIHYAVTLDDVLYSLAGQGVANLCQAYDTLTDSWITKNNLPDNSFWYGSHVAAEGHIYRFCGGGYTAPNKLAHRYDTGSDTWSSLPMFPAATHGSRAAAIGKNIYIAGGYHDFLERDEVWIFDTETEQYTAGTPLPLGRNYHNMVTIDDCFYVLGGNHAIDQSVTFQLLRFCPTETTSVTENKIVSPLTVHYIPGKLLLQFPGSIQGSGTIALYDMDGKLLFLDQLQVDSEGDKEIYVGDLLPAVYLIRFQIGEQAFTSKVVVNE